MHDQVKIPVVSKTKAKSITNTDQEGQKEIVNTVRYNFIGE